jgi:hypothetical protein
VNGDRLGARAKSDGAVEVYKNGTLLGTFDVTGWPYYANGGYIGVWFVNATNALADDFGGGNMTGGEGLMSLDGQSNLMLETTADPFDITVNDGSSTWQGLVVGENQTSRLTFTNVDGTAGKPHTNGVGSQDTVEVLYDTQHQRIQIWTYFDQTGWTQRGGDIPAAIANGDVFSARILSSGIVEIYRNGTLLATRTLAEYSLPLVPNPNVAISKHSGWDENLPARSFLFPR